MPVTQVRSKQQLLINDDVSFQSTYKITNLVDPTAAQDAATKAYVDAVKTGLDVKDSVRLATTGAETYTIVGGAVTVISGTSIDGVTTAVGNRILIKNAPAASGAGAGAGSANTTQPANGIYIVTNATTNTTVSRATDASASADVTAGLFTFVEEGTDGADAGFVLTTNNTITLNTTGLTFTQFSGAGSIVAGAGLTKSGTTIDVVTASSSRIVVNADSIDLATTAVTAATYGSTGFTVSQITVDAYGRLTAASSRDIFGTSIAQNAVFAGPTSGTGAPTFRALVAGDISSIAVTSITGTTNQVIASASTGAITLSLPQSIATSSTPTFAGLTLTSGTQTTSVQAQTVTQTWNAAGVSFLASVINITNTASATASRFIEYQIAGSPLFSIRKDGAITTGIWNATAVAANFGGTGQTSYAVGDLLYADTTTSLAKLADVATGNALISGGVSTAPSWGKIGLTTHISGTLAVGNGGTGLATTPTNGQLLIGNGTNYTLAALTQGTGITVTNGSGSITVAVNTSTILAVANYVVRETPTGTVNGTNPTFTLANTPVSGTEQVFVNGVLQNSGAGNDYTISTATITFLSGAIPQTGDIVRVTYLK